VHNEKLLEIEFGGELKLEMNSCEEDLDRNSIRGWMVRCPRMSYHCTEILPTFIPMHSAMMDIKSESKLKVILLNIVTG